MMEALLQQVSVGCMIPSPLSEGGSYVSSLPKAVAGCSRRVECVSTSSTSGREDGLSFSQALKGLKVKAGLSTVAPKLAKGGKRMGRASAKMADTEAAESTEPDSLVPDTLEAMKGDAEFQRVAQQLRDRGQAALTAEERKQRRRALTNLGVPSFHQFVAEKGLSGALVRKEVGTLQVNIGLYCNQACAHCHVESSPLRTEMMDRATVERLVEVLENSPSVHTVDITGGAPELNSNFRYLVTEARRLGKEVIDRCNLTVLLEPGQQDLAAFLADNQVHVVASLPCYSEANVDVQRGRGVFERSIRALQSLNAIGYGREGSGLVLDLVYNPVGAFLPPPQASLQDSYKKELWENFGIEFNSMFAITNMPIKRFADDLFRKGKLQEYMDLLVSSFNAAALDGIMCTNLVSVRWDGTLFDCDFNQQLALGVPPRLPQTIHDVRTLTELVGQPVACDNHCFGCTAGQGSSCTGAVS